jgi:hypothetical protein
MTRASEDAGYCPAYSREEALRKCGIGFEREIDGERRPAQL